MKNVLRLVLTLLILVVGSKVSYAQAAPIKIDAEHFPDTVFMTNIQGYDNDKDGYLSEQEAGAITSLNYDGGDYKAWKELSSLKGIEYLTSLESICLGYNNIKELDLTYNTNLKNIDIYSVPLQEINLNGNCNLERFEAWNVSLKTLDLTGNDKLKKLFLKNSKEIENIKFGDKPVINTISCEGSGLKTIEIKNMPALKKLNVANTKISKLDVSAASKLKVLYCSGEKISKVILPKNNKLKVALKKDDKVKLSWKSVGKNKVLKSFNQKISKIIKKDTVKLLKTGKVKVQCGNNKCVIKVYKK